MLISTTILFTTIVSAVAIGVGAGYAATWAILGAFSHRPTLSEAPVLVPVETARQNLAASR